MSTPADASPPLAPDDPRLSEWLDGRLSAAEAAAVEEAVGRSSELARLVADLRAIKAAARAAAAASPPPGFADRVMAAVVADRGAGAADASDRLVDAEWRVIEAERIAEERAEAAADLAAEIAPARVAERRRWPWLSLAAALAMGLLVTVVLNVPPREPDEAQVAVATDRDMDPAVRARDLRQAAERKIAAAAPAPAAAVAARELKRPAEESGSRDRGDELAEPIEVVVQGPKGRANLLERLATLGLVAVPTGREPRGGLLELVGPEEAVAAFLADPSGEQSLAKGLPAPAAAARLDDEGAADRAPNLPRRILVRVIQLPAAAGEPSQP